MRKGVSSCITYGFCILLSGAALVSFWWPEKGFSQEENRYLQKLPEFTMEDFLDGTYGSKYEEALSDQFPYRNQWVGVKVTAERLQGKADVNGVYFGKEEYLIEKFESEDLRTTQLQKNCSVLVSAGNQWAKELGGEHVRLMLVPSASQILKDKLPFLAAPYDQMLITQELKQNLEQPELLVNVESVLNEHRQEPVYYRTDHHWTSLGAYYGYTAWAESMNLKPYGQEDFTVSTVSENFQGTIQSKLNLSVRPDSIQIYEPKKTARYQVYYDQEGTQSDSLYYPEALETKDQYRVFLDGNHGLTRIENRTLQAEQGGETGGKLLIIKDSYAHSFAPFAAGHFDTTYMMDLRYYNGDIQTFIQEQGITDLLVLYQIPGFCKERTIGKL